MATRLTGVIVNGLIARVTIANVWSDAATFDTRLLALGLTLGFGSFHEFVTIRAGTDVWLDALSILTVWMTSWNTGVSIVDQCQLASVQRIPRDFPNVLVVWQTATDVWPSTDAMNARWIADWFAKGTVALDSLVTLTTVTDVWQNTLGILTRNVASGHTDVIESVQTVVLFSEIVTEQRFLDLNIVITVVTLAGFWSHAVSVDALFSALWLATKDVIFTYFKTVVTGTFVETRALAIDTGYFTNRFANLIC